MELWALNVCGAIGLERGGIDEATYFFTRAQEEATDDNDMATVGRCANNLGVIANMQGDYKRAVVAYTRAIASYEQAHFPRGVAEARHNLGMVCRAQGRLDRALEIAQTAIEDAQRRGVPAPPTNGSRRVPKSTSSTTCWRRHEFPAPQALELCHRLVISTRWKSDAAAQTAARESIAA